MGLVNLIEIDNHGDSQVACQLVLRDGRVFPSNDSYVGQMVMERALDDDGDVVTADDGKAFLKVLHRHYSGSRLRASKYMKSGSKQFCPTGPGGGVDPSCGSGGVRNRYSKDVDEAASKSEYKTLQGKRDAFEKQSEALEKKAKQIDDHVEKQQLFSEAGVLKHQARMAGYDAMTHRQLHSAVNREAYLQARETTAKSFEDQHTSQMAFRQKILADGVQRLPTEYLAKHGLDTREVDPQEMWRNSTISDLGDGLSIDARLKSVSEKYSGVTESHLLEADRLYSGMKHNWWMNDTTEMKSAYYGEPDKVTRRTGSTGTVDAVVPPKVRRGGADGDVKAFMESAEIGIQIKPQALEKFISSGEMKNGFQKGAVESVGKGKQGYFDIRRDSETELFGEIDDDAKRPIYGYLEHPDRMRSQGDAVGSNYGKVQLRLKADVKARTTYTVGDSIDDQSFWGKGAAPVNDPVSHRNIPTNYTPESQAKYQWKSNIVAGLNSKEWKLVESYVDKGKEVHAERARPQYLEAQVFGGVKLSDIREIRLPEGVDLTPVQQKKLDKAGVAVIKIPPAFSSTFYYSIPDWDAAFKDD